MERSTDRDNESGTGSSDGAELSKEKSRLIEARCRKKNAIR